jgi:gluconate 2-dehydrogenase gamma chain
MGRQRGIKARAGTVERRDFLIGTAAAGAGLLSGCRAGGDGGWEFLSEEDAQSLKVLCDQIVPADDFPSASEAGVLEFIDRQLVRALRRYRSAYRDGLERANSLSRRRFGRELAGLGPADQLEAVKMIENEDRDFFELVRSHTLDGYYGSPRHGGNRDAISWRMLGLAEPPFNGRAQYDLKRDGSS